MLIRRYILVLGALVFFLLALIARDFYLKDFQRKQISQAKGGIHATILSLSCGREDFIRLEVNGKEKFKRIYLNEVECIELKQKKTIGVFMDSRGSIVFVNEAYNDSSQSELIAGLILVSFFTLAIIWKGFQKKQL